MTPVRPTRERDIHTVRTTSIATSSTTTSQSILDSEGSSSDTGAPSSSAFNRQKAQQLHYYFQRLKEMVPGTSKPLSRVQLIYSTIDYITDLQEALEAKARRRVSTSTRPPLISIQQQRNALAQQVSNTSTTAIHHNDDSTSTQNVRHPLASVNTECSDAHQHLLGRTRADIQPIIASLSRASHIYRNSSRANMASTSEQKSLSLSCCSSTSSAITHHHSKEHFRIFHTKPTSILQNPTTPTKTIQSVNPQEEDISKKDLRVNLGTQQIPRTRQSSVSGQSLHLPSIIMTLANTSKINDARDHQQSSSSGEYVALRTKRQQDDIESSKEKVKYLKLRDTSEEKQPQATHSKLCRLDTLLERRSAPPNYSFDKQQSDISSTPPQQTKGRVIPLSKLKHIVQTLPSEDSESSNTKTIKLITRISQTQPGSSSRDNDIR